MSEHKVIFPASPNNLHVQFVRGTTKLCLGFALGLFAPGANFNQTLAFESVKDPKTRIDPCLPKAKMSFESWNLPFQGLPKTRGASKGQKKGYKRLPKAKIGLRNLNRPFQGWPQDMALKSLEKIITSSKGQKGLEKATTGPKRLQKAPKGSKRHQRFPKDSKRLQ